MIDLLQHLWRWLRALYSEIPFIGRLDFADRPTIARATLETAVTIFASSFPVWLAILVLFLPDLSWARATHEVVKNGELFLLSAATVGPLIYVVSIVYNGNGDRRFSTSFPHGIYYLLFTAIMIAVSAVIIALRSMQTVGNGEGFDISAYATASWWCYGLAIFVFFTASAHRNRLEHPPTNINKPSEESFDNRWRHRNGE